MKVLHPGLYITLLESTSLPLVYQECLIGGTVNSVLTSSSDPSFACQWISETVRGHHACERRERGLDWEKGGRHN